jgi:hypothetical protein
MATAKHHWWVALGRLLLADRARKHGMVPVLSRQRDLNRELITCAPVSAYAEDLLALLDPRERRRAEVRHDAKRGRAGEACGRAPQRSESICEAGTRLVHEQVRVWRGAQPRCREVCERAKQARQFGGVRRLEGGEAFTGVGQS